MKRLTAQFIIAFSLSLAVFSVRADCGPSIIAPACGQGSIASAGQLEPGLTLAAGNPVHLVTGNKYQRDIDLPVNPAAPGLELIRHYNAMDHVRPSVLGRGWTLSYDTRLFRVHSGWQVLQADGGRVDFPDTSADPGGTHRTRHGRLEHINGHHTWFWPSGTVIRFDNRGQLILIRWVNGENVRVTRNEQDGPLNGVIQHVRNDHDQVLAFHYDIVGEQARLVSVETPLGRFGYDYDDPVHDGSSGASTHRLLRVIRPDAMQRHYLHEPVLQAGHVYAITGIEISSGTSPRRHRLNTWEYDRQGRAIRSSAGGPQSTHQLVRFDYRRRPSAQHPGLTVVSNEHQKKTWFHTALRSGRLVLTHVHGAGCAGCAAPGTQADYDDQGRMISINGTRIRRTPSGRISALTSTRSGWPGLTQSFDSGGRRDYWHSDRTGTERIRYDAHNLPVERRFANGDTTVIEYDTQHRPVTMHEKHGDAQTATRLRWHGHRLVGIEHPSETESRRYDDRGRVVWRDVTRDTDTSPHPLRVTEQFEYDDNNRLIRHHLPEGGTLHYDWGAGPQLKAITWQDVNGRRHKIIQTLPGLPGYRYENGLHLDTVAGPDHLIRQLRLHHQNHLVWAQELSYDAQQRIATDIVSASTPSLLPAVISRRYAYDDASRLTGHRHAYVAGNQAESPTSATTWLAWHADGSALASRVHGQTDRPAVHHDASGLPLHADGADLAYGASRRLNAIMRDGQLVARYQHNAFGYRISRQATGKPRTDFFYLKNQVVAQTDHPDTPDAHNSMPAPLITRRYVYAHHVPVAIIDYTPRTPEGQHFAIHADLLGAPRLITDQDRRIRWHADYSPLGQVSQIAGDMRLDLRLPGQIEDPDTGWHDNLLRTYIPQRGHYLEPDPLGPLPGTQTYGYAAQQPRRYSDPMGLLLFAFDGTRQSADTQSNVWKMSQYYLDGPVHYHPGPGNAMFIDWDAVAAHQAAQIIETQWNWLLYELSRPRTANEIIPIDILGFSRGAALARHFGNLINQNLDEGVFRYNDPFYGSVSACVDLRFMGLFDTVAQFGIGGTQNRNYDLTIAAAWGWVAHAVALHERRWLLPLTTAAGSGSDNVVEAPFVGAHSDIGGGILPADRGKPGGRGDLSDLTLQWMLWQARAASVPFGNLTDDHRTITQPILHDQRSPALRQIQDGDRSIDAASGTPWLNYQNDHPRLGHDTREQAEHLITRVENWRSSAGVEVGIVDMDGYAHWLHRELGWRALSV